MPEPVEKPTRRLSPAQTAKIRADIDLLASEDQKLAWQAVSRLGRRRGQVVELLIEATASPNSDVRHLALHALERVGDPRAVSVCLEMAHDPVMDNRWCAYEILGKLWRERAVPILAEVLRNADVLLNTESDGVEVDGAWRGLMAIGSPAIPALIDVMENAGPFARGSAARVLGRIPDAAVIEPLSSLLSKPDSVKRCDGIVALSWLGQDNPQAFGHVCLDLVEPLVNDPAEDVREVAASELSELRRAIEGL